MGEGDGVVIASVEQAEGPICPVPQSYLEALTGLGYILSSITSVAPEGLTFRTSYFGENITRGAIFNTLQIGRDFSIGVRQVFGYNYEYERVTPHVTEGDFDDMPMDTARLCLLWAVAEAHGNTTSMAYNVKIDSWVATFLWTYGYNSEQITQVIEGISSGGITKQINKVRNQCFQDLLAALKRSASLDKGDCITKNVMVALLAQKGVTIA